METYSTYDMLVNGDGELLIVINKIEGTPEEPRLEHDGSDKAILFKSRDQAITLDGLSEEAESLLRNVDTILIVEVDGDNFVCEYMASVEHIKQ